MSFLRRWLGRGEPSEADQGPLYGAVREAMREVQAYARSHGGSIELLAVTPEGDVQIRLKGTCKSCPMSGLTIKLGVEQRLKVLVPEVRRVVPVD